MLLCINLHDFSTSNIPQDTRHSEFVFRLYYRHYLLRTYVNELVRIFGSVNRRSDLGKSLSWPPAPKPMAQVGPMLRGAHARWRAWKILSKYPRESWPEMNLKV